MGWFSRSATRSARGGPSAHRRLIESLLYQTCVRPRTFGEITGA